MVAIFGLPCLCRCCGVPFGPGPDTPSPPTGRQGFPLTSLMRGRGPERRSAPCAGDVGGGRLNRAGRSGRPRLRTQGDRGARQHAPSSHRAGNDPQASSVAQAACGRCASRRGATRRGSGSAPFIRRWPGGGRLAGVPQWAMRQAGGVARWRGFRVRGRRASMRLAGPFPRRPGRPHHGPWARPAHSSPSNAARSRAGSRQR